MRNVRRKLLPLIVVAVGIALAIVHQPYTSPPVAAASGKTLIGPQAGTVTGVGLSTVPAEKLAYIGLTLVPPPPDPTYITKAQGEQVALKEVRSEAGARTVRESVLALVTDRLGVSRVCWVVSMSLGTMDIGVRIIPRGPATSPEPTQQETFYIVLIDAKTGMWIRTSRGAH